MTESELLDELRKFNDPIDGLRGIECLELISIYGRAQWDAGYQTAVQEWEKSSLNPWRDND